MDLSSTYKYLKGVCKEDEARPFSVVPSKRMTGNRHKLEDRKFHLKLRKEIFNLRLTEHWNKLPRKVVESPSPEILQ